MDYCDVPSCGNIIVNHKTSYKCGLIDNYNRCRTINIQNFTSMWWASFVISLSITIMNTYLLKGNYCITMFNVKNLKYIKTWTKSAIIKLSNIELFLYLQLFEYWIYFVKFVKFVESIPCYSNPCLNGGTCKNTGKSFTCTCLSAYHGDRCENEGSLCIDVHDAND